LSLPLGRPGVVRDHVLAAFAAKRAHEAVAIGKIVGAVVQVDTVTMAGESGLRLHLLTPAKDTARRLLA
jgi:hypothetical protein